MQTSTRDTNGGRSSQNDKYETKKKRKRPKEICPVLEGLKTSARSHLPLKRSTLSPSLSETRSLSLTLSPDLLSSYQVPLLLLRPASAASGQCLDGQGWNLWAKHFPITGRISGLPPEGEVGALSLSLSPRTAVERVIATKKNRLLRGWSFLRRVYASLEGN